METWVSFSERAQKPIAWLMTNPSNSTLKRLLITPYIRNLQNAYNNEWEAPKNITMTGFHLQQHAHIMEGKEHVNWTTYTMIPVLHISCKSRMELPDQDEIGQLSHCTLFHKRVVLLILLISLGARGYYHIQAYFCFIQHAVQRLLKKILQKSQISLL
jgi:hypothetical protein